MTLDIHKCPSHGAAGTLFAGSSPPSADDGWPESVDLTYTCTGQRSIDGCRGAGSTTLAIASAPAPAAATGSVTWNEEKSEYVQSIHEAHRWDREKREGESGQGKGGEIHMEPVDMDG